MKIASLKELILRTTKGPTRNAQKGYSLVEVIIIMSVAALLFGFVTINLLGTQQHVSLTTIASSILTTIRSQQLKAMEGASDTTTAYSYGVHIEQHSYTLFKGIVYSASDPSNGVIQVDSTVTLTSTFPSSSLSFSQGSGELVGFASGNNTITITDTSNNQTRVLTFNRYGVVTSIQ